MPSKIKMFTGVAILVAVFAVGRYTTPERIKVEIHTVEVEKKISEKEESSKGSSHTRKTKKKIIRPDGTKEETETTTTDSETSKEGSSKDTSDSSKSSDETKEVVKGGGGRVTVSGMAAMDVHSATGFVYGVGVSKQILGPFSAGVFGLTNGVIGVTVGISL